ncbi:MAG: IPT/TIG domain-containing protein [Planctomycetales bacterium]|nr:IPT/TIG domain-containing protein [Planctomycetales bacterium]
MLARSLLALCALAVAAGCSDDRRRQAGAGGAGASGPTITSVTPVSGPTAGGTAITITGTNFVTGATVAVGGTAATSVTVVSGTTITAVTPAGAAGPANVVVTNPDTLSATATSAYTYTSGPPPAPTVTAVNPTSGPTAGGTAITITGTGFQTGATVTVGGAAATSVTVLSAATITAVTPAGTAGPASVTVTNPDTQTGTLTGGFTYTGGPTLSSVSPSSGDVSGGTPVTLTGTGFQTGATVTLGGTLATGVVIVSPTTINCQTPSGSAGPVTVTMTNPDSTSASLSSGFTYTTGGTTPTVTSLSPTSGPAAGGTLVTITGSNFQTGAVVTIGGVAATSVTFVNSTSITAVVPAAVPGASPIVTVTVTNPGGASGSLASGFTYVPTPVAATSTNSTVPDAAVDSQGRVHVVWMETIAGPGYEVRYRRSTDGGATWSATTTVSGASTNAWNPAVATRGNDVFVVWREYITASSTYHVYYAYSTDAGANWSSPASLQNTGSSFPDPDVAITSTGTVAVVYDALSGSSTYRIFCITGTVGGSFGSPVNVSNLVSFVDAPAVATSGGSTILVAWTEIILLCGGPGMGMDTFFARSTDGGATFSTPANLSQNCAAMPMRPAVAASGARVVVAWDEGSGLGGREILTKSSTDAGATFGNTSANPSTGNGTAMDAALAFDAAGTLTVAWDEPPAGSPTDIWVARSTTGGATYSAPVNISANSGTSLSPAVGSGNGTTVTVWSDNTGGNYDILAY